jgi:hypothetical protein
MRASWTAFAIALALAGLPERTGASTLFELPPADPFAAGTLFSDAQHPREAASFFTLVEGATLDGLAWWGGYFSFEDVPNPVTSPFEIRVFTDTGTCPADVPFVAAAVTASVTPFPASLPQFEYHATLAQPGVLPAGTYWLSIVDVDPANPTFAWRKSTEVSSSFSRLPGGDWGETPGLASMRLEGSFVPEPGTGALAALGLAGLGAARARRPPRDLVAPTPG